MSTPASWQFKPKRRWQPMGLDFVSASLCLCLCLSLCVSVWVGDCAQCERNNKAYALTSDKVKGRADGCCCLRALPRYAVQQKWNWSVGSLVPDRLLTRHRWCIPHGCMFITCTLPRVIFRHQYEAQPGRQAAEAISGTLLPIDMPWQSTLFLRQPVGSGRCLLSHLICHTRLAGGSN